MTRPKIAVLGGGIAGAAACLALAARGVTPQWIARQERLTDKPGESLAAAARPILDSLGALDLLDTACHRPSHSVFSAWGRDMLVERSGILHLEGPGTVLDRLAFERQLTDRALAAGAEQVTAQVTGCTRDGTGWRIAMGGDVRRADYVIDATGRSAVLARQRAQRFRADQLAVLYAFPDQDQASDVAPTQATVIEAVPDGWWYAAYLPGGRLALNYYSDVDLLPEGAARDPAIGLALLAQTRHVSRWVAEAGFRFDGSLTLGSATTAWLAPCAGAGWLAAGDAAAAFDPLSSHGLTTALWCGAQAAGVALAGLSGDTGPTQRYTEAVARGVQEFLEARARMYRMEPRFARLCLLAAPPGGKG